MATTINKIGGKNMSQLDEVANLVKILERRKENITLVVSAFTKVTNGLIASMDKLDMEDYDEAGIGEAFEPVTALHEEVISRFFKEENQGDVRQMYHTELDELAVSLLEYKQEHHSLKPGPSSFQMRDRVIGFGEVMAAKLLEKYLKQEGHEAQFIDDVSCSEDLTSDTAFSVNRLHEVMQAGISESLLSVQQNRASVVRILGGYVAGTPRGIAVDVGRSYTDTTAVNVALAAMKNGEKVTATRFWKDVPGVLTANPKALNGNNHPVLHGDISITEGLEMASAGSGLMHIDSLALARKHGIDLELRDIREPGRSGTFYTNTEILTGHGFKAIITNPHIDSITMAMPEMANRKGFASAISNVFARHDLSIDGIFTEGSSMSFSIPMPQDEADREAKRDKVREALSELKRVVVDGEEFSAYRTTWGKSNLASLAIVGNELSNTVGILSEITGVLSAYGINIQAISHSESQKRITIMIPHDKAQLAEQKLHSVFVDRDAEVIKDYGERRRKISEVLVSTYKH